MPLREQVEDILTAAPVGTVVTIDVDGIEVFDFSFAAEFFGRLLQRLPTEYPGRFLVVENLGPWTGPNLEAALAGLDLAMVHRAGDGQLELIGKVAETDRRTFGALLASGGRATAPELASRLDVNVTAMNERLGKLLRSGIVRREGDQPGRSRFTYLTPA